MKHSREALLIVNMGGPADESGVRDFLKAIFADPAILSMPGLLRRPLGALIVALRTQKVIDKYSIIGGGSPLFAWTVSLVNNLNQLASDRTNFERISYAFRYTSPSIADSLMELKAAGIGRITVLPLFPHYTSSMTGSIFSEVQRVAEELSLTTREIPAWGQHQFIIDLQRDLLGAALSEAGTAARVLFVAHGIPVSNIRRGDDYPAQVEASARALGASLSTGTQWSLAYQSKVGPAKWTEPDLEDELDRLTVSKQPLVIMPLSFVADCLETLYDLDIIAAGKLREAGIEKYVRVPVFNDDPRFAEALIQIVNGDRG